MGAPVAMVDRPMPRREVATLAGERATEDLYQIEMLKLWQNSSGAICCGQGRLCAGLAIRRPEITIKSFNGWEFRYHYLDNFFSIGA